MSRPSNTRLISILFFSVLILLGFAVFLPQIKYGLAGDENRALLLLKSNFSTLSIQSITNLIPYGGSPLIMLTVSLMFGYAPVGYYVASLLLRALAAFSLYMFGRDVLKSKVAGFCSALLFMVSFAGVETSAPANMGTYLSLAFMNFGFIKFFNYLFSKNKSRQTLVIAFGWFTIAILFNSVRMHGLIILFIVVTAASALLRVSKFRISVMLIAAFVTLIIVIKNLGFIGSSGTSAEVARSLLSANFLSSIQNPVRAVLYTLVSFYQVIFVPSSSIIHSIITSTFSTFNLNEWQAFIVLTSPSIALAYYLVRVRKQPVLMSILPTGIWIALLLLMKDIFSRQLQSDGSFMLVGGAITMGIFRLVLLFAHRQPKRALVLLTLLAWPFCFVVIPHLMWPGLVNYTFSRYLSISTAGACLLTTYMAFQTTKVVPSKLRFLSKVAVAALFIGAFSTNMAMTNNHFHVDGERGLYFKYIQANYKIMDNEIGDRTNKARPVVILTADDSDFATLSVTEGGEERFSLIHNNTSETVRPFFVANLNDLIEIYCFDKYNLKTKLEDIYSFNITNKTMITDSDTTRLKVDKAIDNRRDCTNKFIK